MPRKIVQLRHQAFVNQSGFCYYCNRPMWQCSPDIFAQQHHLTLAQSSRFQCTAEHLVPRQSGGPTTRNNIVAACKFCNSKRHARSNELCPTRYKTLVKKRLAAGRWHPQLPKNRPSRRADLKGARRE